MNVAVTLGDAGTAVDVARGIDLSTITVAERKASLLVDLCRAFLQWGRFDKAYAAIRAAEEIAPEEVRGGHQFAGLSENWPARHRRLSGVRLPGSRLVSERPREGWRRSRLAVVVCGAGPAAAIGTFIRLAQDRGWTVQVIATPSALDFFDELAIGRLAGSPVKSEYGRAGTPRSDIPDVVVVAPATYNTINKWAQGISDTYALGVLAEVTGLDIPVVVLPFVNSALAGRIRSAGASMPSAANGCACCSVPAVSTRIRPHGRKSAGQLPLASDAGRG